MNQRDILVVDMARGMLTHHGTRACSFGIMDIGWLFLAASHACDVVVSNAVEMPDDEEDIMHNARYALAAFERLAFATKSFWCWEAYETLMRLAYPVSADGSGRST